MDLEHFKVLGGIVIFTHPLVRKKEKIRMAKEKYMLDISKMSLAEQQRVALAFRKMANRRFKRFESDIQKSQGIEHLEKLLEYKKA